MRYLIFSDVHGNLEALQALLKFIKSRKIDRYLFLGDLVGYGASPNDVVRELKSLKPMEIVRGNHDKAVCNLESLTSFNPIAAAAIKWTRKKIGDSSLKYLSQMKKGPLVLDDTITLCHGAPFDEDFYIFGEFDAAEAFLHIRTPICFYGHTHFPFVYIEKGRLVEGIPVFGNTREFKLKKNARYLINPGSIGQPRDRNPRASCAIYNSETKKIKFYRFSYDIKGAQKRILQESLPPALAERLTIGI